MSNQKQHYYSNPVHATEDISKITHTILVVTRLVIRLVVKEMLSGKLWFRNTMMIIQRILKMKRLQHV